jgi:cytokinin dehydrogenase
VAPRGEGRSWRGQALAPSGVVVDMSSFGRGHHAPRNNVSAFGTEPFIHAGGEQLWIDVCGRTS